MVILCKICNKEYKSYSSKSNHMKKYHSDIAQNLAQTAQNLAQTAQKPSLIHIPITENNKKELICEHCNTEFNRSFNLKRHMEKCKNKKNNDQNMIDKIKILEETQKNMEKKIEELEKAKPSNQVNNKSIVKGNVYNGTINNTIQINAVGNEPMNLSIDEIKSIFDKKVFSLIKYLELLNFDEKRKNNHSFCTTNRDGKHLLTYDAEKAEVVSNKKKYFYLNVIHKAIVKLEMLFKNNKKEFNKEQQQVINERIEMLKEISNLDFSNRRLKGLLDELNLLSYNSRKVVLDTWEKKEGTISKPIDVLKNVVEEDMSGNDTEDYKKIFLPLKNVIEAYGSDFSDYSSSSDDEEDESTYTRPELVKSKKVIKMEQSSEQSSELEI